MLYLILLTCDQNIVIFHRRYSVKLYVTQVCSGTLGSNYTLIGNRGFSPLGNQCIHYEVDFFAECARLVSPQCQIFCHEVVSALDTLFRFEGQSSRGNYRVGTTRLKNWWLRMTRAVCITRTKGAVRHLTKSCNTLYLIWSWLSSLSVFLSQSISVFEILAQACSCSAKHCS